MAEDEWDGKITNLKISEEAFPELYHELSRLRRKARGDRLRALAFLGLHALRPSAGAAAQGDSLPAAFPGARGKGQANAEKDTLRDKLLDSV